METERWQDSPTLVAQRMTSWAEEQGVSISVFVLALAVISLACRMVAKQPTADA